MLPIIKEWILPGTMIISDGWKAYSNLSEHGYQHSVVNHSEEWKNMDGHTTNKIEGIYICAYENIFGQMSLFIYPSTKLVKERTRSRETVCEETFRSLFMTML